MAKSNSTAAPIKESKGNILKKSARGESVDAALGDLSDGFESLASLFDAIDHACGRLFESMPDADMELVGLESIAKRGYSKAYALVDIVGKLRKAKAVQHA